MKVFLAVITCLFLVSCSENDKEPELTGAENTTYVTVKNNINGETITIIKHIENGSSIKTTDVCKIQFSETSPVVDMECGANLIIFPFRLSSKQYVSVHDFETVECVNSNFEGVNTKNNPIKVELNKSESGKLYLKSIN